MSKFVSALIAVLAFALSCEAATQIKKLPYTIKKSGQYVLKKSLKYSNLDGAAISIEAAEVTLDLGGFTLWSNAEANDTNGAIGIECFGDHRVTVRNGVVRGFLKGLDLSTGATGRVIVEDLIVEESGRTGIDISGQLVTVRSCQVRNTGFVTSGVTINIWGILVSASTAIVEQNQVNNLSSPGGQTVRGIQTSGSRGSTIRSNEVRSASTLSAGIILFNGAANFATDNVIADSTIGLQFANGAPGKYRDNLTQNCATPFSGGTAVGSNS